MVIKILQAPVDFISSMLISIREMEFFQETGAAENPDEDASKRGPEVTFVEGFSD